MRNRIELYGRRAEEAQHLREVMRAYEDEFAGLVRAAMRWPVGHSRRRDAWFDVIYCKHAIEELRRMVRLLERGTALDKVVPSREVGNAVQTRARGQHVVDNHG